MLRYFRFPSPPRTTEDNSDSSHMDRKTRPRMQHQMSQTSSGGDCKKKDGGREGRSAYADRGRRRRNGNSSCSCMTSSTSDTASEIAYPDLRPRRLKAALSTSQQVLTSSVFSKIKFMRSIVWHMNHFLFYF